MATKSPPGDKIEVTRSEADPGHAVWKRAKIERGLSETADRSAMIPADEVWRKLGLER